MRRLYSVILVLPPVSSSGGLVKLLVHPVSFTSFVYMTSLGAVCHRPQERGERLTILYAAIFLPAMAAAPQAACGTVAHWLP